MKKLLSLILIFCLTLSTVATASAVSTDSKALESAITSVKRIITIPSEFSNFSHYTYENEIDGVKTTMWQLNWNHPQGKGDISVTVDSNGNITNYYRYIYKDKPNSTISDLSLADGKKIALEFLDKVWSEYAGQMIEITDTPVYPIMPLATSEASSATVSVSDAVVSDARAVSVASMPLYPSESFSYTFRLFKNGLPVNFVKAYVTVDKNTKEVINYYKDTQYSTSYTYSDASDLISKEEAGEAYIKHIGLNIEYFSSYNDKTKTMDVFPAYVLSSTSGKYIDAKTGEPVSLYMRSPGYGIYAKNAMSEDSVQGGSGSASREIALTEEEQIAVDVMATLMSKSEAEKVARKLPGITSSMKVTYTNLNGNYYDKTKYVWYIGFENAYVSLDAKTGEIVNYSIYNDSGKGSKKLTVDAAKEIADAFAKNLNADKFAQVEYNYNPSYFRIQASDDGNEKLIAIPQPAELTSYYFDYSRSVDGTLFKNNNISVSVDKTTGEVTNYYLNWYDNVTFPLIENAMSKEDAFDAFDKYFNYSVSYEQTTKGAASPIYSFNSGEGSMIHPNTGIRLNWDGKPYQDNTIDYKDIEGHWAEDVIRTLAENGYYLNSADENFYPDKAITQLDFFMYCYGGNASGDIDRFYETLIQNGVITENEKAPQANVSRQDAAKYITRLLGLEKIAQKGNIFIYPFKDNVAASYKGYITATSALNIMSGDSKGNFNPSKALSNAQAAAIVHNYLKVK